MYDVIAKYNELNKFIKILQTDKAHHLKKRVVRTSDIMSQQVPSVGLKCLNVPKLKKDSCSHGFWNDKIKNNKK